ncbi:MAG: LLM class F420-dependent oxidoreductase [Candidatus Lambdaproteobacteria bacterium]|nr:LLM class F420-dependent oxidoreductase [Candidatus Lambdaproteobacteria bacterium]
MDYGIVMFPTDYAIPPAELGRAAEERGFGALFFPEHTHIPSSRATPWPGGRELPREYSHTLDPFVALSAAAAVTRTIRLGTGICLVVEHDPIVLAKSVASLDHLSGGRAMLGIGGGWNQEEMANHGTDYAMRWTLMRERVEAMKEIWTRDEASYDGQFVKFEKIWSWPKPVQKPHPPVIMGGDGPRTFQRVLRYGDEWMPINRHGMLEVLPRKIETLQEQAAAAGRAPIPVTLFSPPPDPAMLRQLAAAGVSRFVFAVPPAPAEVVLPKLDKLANVMQQAV